LIDDDVVVGQIVTALEIVVHPDPSFWSVRIAQGNGPPQFRFSRPIRAGYCHHRSWGNDQYRVCFGWTGAGAEEVEFVDCH
jgi:hypothetical protein